MLGHHAASSVDGAIHFVCMDWRHAGELLAAGRRGLHRAQEPLRLGEDQRGHGVLYRSQHELVFAFKAGRAPHTNNVELGRHGRTRTNVWTYPGVNSFGAGRDEALAMHPTVKPVRLVADAILDCSRRGDLVLDGFAGSGTTLLAAERTGRIGYGLEIEPRYVDVAIRRLAEHAGLEAIHAESGLPFAEVGAMRARAEGSERPGVRESAREVYPVKKGRRAGERRRRQLRGGLPQAAEADPLPAGPIGQPQGSTQGHEEPEDRSHGGARREDSRPRGRALVGA